ncbi:uncharacterized protein LOC117119913 [Anneissia japonica]|uniref:uncharacterized protein LOC117119913 n=1 Tax=Anneissia japonica TaxID=1529436 RepID=UPI00142589D7|nr:uncharacterized protein LOC117119913 [Anneissia japonica]
MRQFTARVVGCTDTDDEKLYYLEQFTKGEANKGTGFSYLDSKTAYSAAMKELEDRYGDQDVIANAFMKKALAWPPIRSDNPKSLDVFSIFLCECESAIKCINALGVMEYSENIKNIVRKLPYYLHDRWRSLVSKLKDEGKTVKFHDLTQFVKKEAKKANDPTYGKAALSVNSTDTGKRGSFHNQRAKGIYATKLGDNKETKAQSNNTSVTPNPVRTCYICKKGEHRVDKCGVFLAKTIQDRINLVKEAGMCFGCLRHGHRSKECRNRGTCQKSHKRHPTVLHRDKVPACRVEVERPESSKDMVLDITGSNPSCHTGAGNTICTMAIVPVLARSKRSGLSIETYAFMDPGSSVSFCTDELRKKLGLGGRKARITLDTMGTSHTLDTRIVTGIELRNLEATHTLELPNVYSKGSMPVSHVHIPRKKDIEEWPHMERVQLPDIDAEIGLLIGNAVAEAYTPLEIVTGPPGSPYASRTALGWIPWNVVRKGNSNEYKTDSYPSNRAEVTAIEELEEIKKLNHAVTKAMQIDFPENGKNEKLEMSQDDRTFLKLSNDNMKFKDGKFEIPLPFRNRNHLMPNNYSLAVKRLSSLRMKMQRNADFMKDYTTCMENMIEKGYA